MTIVPDSANTALARVADAQEVIVELPAPPVIDGQSMRLGTAPT